MASIINIPSYQVNAGETIAIRDKAQKQMRIQGALEISSQMGRPDWVEVDEKKLTGVLRVTRARRCPARHQ